MFKKFTLPIVIAALSLRTTAQETDPTITGGHVLQEDDTLTSEWNASHIPILELEDAEADNTDDGFKQQAISSVLTASRDPYLNTAAFVFSSYRFRIRGYERNDEWILINGAPMNDLRTGAATWSQWGGLNDFFRGRISVFGLSPSQEAFGGISGTTSFHVAAATLPPQTRFGYALSNRQYRHRLMITHASGLSRRGWAYAFSLSTRQAREGFVPGTFFEGYSGIASLSKKIRGHTFDLTTFAAPTRRGKAAATTQEAYNLANSPYYNPNWGYQNGVKRNAKINQRTQPAAILSHRYSSSDFNIQSAVGYQFGRNSNSALDWYLAKDPRPDYYRYLPSWYLYNQQHAIAFDVMERWEQDPNTYAQINWAQLYEINQTNEETIHDVAGVKGNSITGNRAIYVVAQDVEALRRYSFNTTVEKTFGERLTVQSGVSFIIQQTESYKQLEDLLGADFFVNLNQFADEQLNPGAGYDQYDLNHPNRLIYEGDIYQYHYILRQRQYQGWLQATINLNRLDIFVAGAVRQQTFAREGIFRNGLYPDNSYGASPIQRFPTYGLKAGSTWKISGRHYTFLNASSGTEAPLPDQTFISIRTRNQTTERPSITTFHALEGGYLMKLPRHKARLVAYWTRFSGETEIRRFYNDDPAFRTFVNYVLDRVGKQHSGIECGIESAITSNLTITGVAAIGRSVYSNNPSASIYRDNDTSITARSRKVYIKNYRLAVGPQSAYSLGLQYRSPKYWQINISGNYFGRNFVAINPERRTIEAIGLTEPGSEQYQKILRQEQLQAFCAVNLFLSKSILVSKTVKRFPRNTFLYLNLGINNLLNNRSIVMSGFEQLRFNFAEKNPDLFPSKYSYGYGINYFINLSVKF